MTITQIKKQEAKVEMLKKKAARAEFELDMQKSEWDIQNGNYKVFKTSAELKAYVKKKLRQMPSSTAE
ncbi:MAG: hypothetical protein Q8Q03_00705 [bacterium]|nr:hypothetical protein [bacterium]